MKESQRSSGCNFFLHSENSRFQTEEGSIFFWWAIHDLEIDILITEAEKKPHIKWFAAEIIWGILQQILHQVLVLVFLAVGLEHLDTH